jgi:hypothetical protein
MKHEKGRCHRKTANEDSRGINDAESAANALCLFFCTIKPKRPIKAGNPKGNAMQGCTKKCLKKLV